MIIDELSHLKDYTGVHPLLQHVIDFLAEHDLSAMDDGRYPVDADSGSYVNIQTIPFKEKAYAKLESHRKMIDIQIPLTGDEEMGYVPVSRAEAAPYDEQKDITFHPGCTDNYVTVKKGMFAIFFPQDVHAPGITSVSIKKAVFKIPVK